MSGGPVQRSPGGDLPFQSLSKSLAIRIRHSDVGNSQAINGSQKTGKDAAFLWGSAQPPLVAAQSAR